jgi:hypothetical protein
MNKNRPAPGVSRPERISDDGLARLEHQLASGINISPLVLAQWIKRYGEPAVAIIKKYQQHDPDAD